MYKFLQRTTHKSVKDVQELLKDIVGGVLYPPSPQYAYTISTLQFADFDIGSVDKSTETRKEERRRAKNRRRRESKRRTRQK